ncbi:RNA-directed DNA polymerase, eukaryota, reverse transcriptase zinc-binding domain protein [Tanacetum coccineum]
MVRWIMVCISIARFTINLNGERKGYFSSGRGLRQGDPMSSCLFTLVMEVTLLMAKNVQQNENFKFHMGCKELKLSHLCFVDDMLVISHGDVESVRIIRDTMRELSDISILIPNMDKSTLPMKYLEVPLMTKRLSSKDCRQLIDKVKNRVDDWKNKYLSYAGRLQLIASVLSSLNVYWTVVLLITKTVVKDTNKILKGFLRCKGETKRGKAKVASKTLCSPKSQGGLGLRMLGLWNEVLQVKNTISVKWANVIKREWKSKLFENWDTLVDQYASSVCNNSIGSILIWIVVASAVYHIWKERNSRLFTGEVTNENTLLKIYIENIKMQLMCLTVKKSSNVKKIALNWNVKENFKGKLQEVME